MNIYNPHKMQKAFENILHTSSNRGMLCTYFKITSDQWKLEDFR